MQKWIKGLQSVHMGENLIVDVEADLLTGHTQDCIFQTGMLCYCFLFWKESIQTDCARRNGKWICSAGVNICKMPATKYVCRIVYSQHSAILQLLDWPKSLKKVTRWSHAIPPMIKLLSNLHFCASHFIRLWHLVQAFPSAVFQVWHPEFSKQRFVGWAHLISHERSTKQYMALIRLLASPNFIKGANFFFASSTNTSNSFTVNFDLHLRASPKISICENAIWDLSKSGR